MAFCALLLVCLAARADRFAARLLDQGNGLGNLQVNALARSPGGPLWVATENGIYRYDGSGFRDFGRQQGLDDPDVFSLLLDHAGTLWAGTHNGLFWFDGQSFHKLPAVGGELRIGINSMLTAMPDDEILLSTSRGLYAVTRRGAPATWKAAPVWLVHPGLPKLDDSDGVLADQAGALWFGCAAGLCQAALGGAGHGPSAGLSAGTGAHLQDQARLPQGVAKDFYVSLYQSRDGRLWARGRKHILTWRPGDARVTDLSTAFPAGGLQTVFRRFTEDAWGNILTPTAKGFATWDGHQWTETERTGKGLIEGASDIFCDREGIVWIGTQGLGLLESRGYGGWQSAGVEEGLASPNVLAIARDGLGRMWFGTGLGADLLPASGDRLVKSALSAKKDAGGIVSLAPDAGTGMWAASLLGHLYHLDAAGRIDRQAAIDAYVQRIRLDAQGTLWVATSAGLYTLAPRAQMPLLYPAPALANHAIGDLALGGDGRVWVASDRGLDLLTGGGVTHIAVPGQSGSLRSVMQARDGTLWIAGQMPKLLHLRVVGGHVDLLAAYARPQLASDLIEFVQPDTRGRVWIGTDHGVQMKRDGTLYRLDEKNGLISNVCITNAFWADRDGSVWVGTALGVSHLKDPDAMLTRQPFATVLDSVQYGGRGFASDKPMPWNGSALALRFSTSSLRDSEAMLYHASLMGAAAETRSTEANTLLLERLPPGRYQLTVVAEDTGRRAYSAPVRFSFMLAPPWWHTRLAVALLVLLLLSVFILLWQWRHFALLARQRKLELQIEERTRELEAMATHDGLTGLLNRKAVLDALHSELKRLRRLQGDLCVALIDLDHFKSINDTHGHLVGDAVLRAAAERLMGAVRSSDLVGRYGGEEFLVVFRDANRELGLERCELIRNALSAQSITHDSLSLTVTCSIGLAWSQADGDQVADLLTQADKALYVAKRKGRNRVEVSDGNGL